MIGSFLIVKNSLFVRVTAVLALSLAPFCIGRLRAQEPAVPALEPSIAKQASQDPAEQNASLPCVQPPPLVSWQDYNGPFAKTVGIFARKLERKSVHPPHYKPGLILCTLEPKDKFLLFVHDTLDPVTFLGAAFNAGLDQAQDTDHSFGQGAAGYGKRFGAELAGQATGGFFKDFAYPTIFSEDPRYYRLAHGSARRRLAHALEHAFVAHRESGTRMFNVSEWLGTTTAAVLSNTYHPDNQRGVAATSRRVVFTVLQDTGFDVLREFWPEAARALKLPFRGQNEPLAQLQPTGR
jgi:hypothetical protein